MYAPPSIGDLVLAEVQDIGRHTEWRSVPASLCTCFLVITSWVRSATATPRTSTRVTCPRDRSRCDLLSVGGVCGEVASQHASMLVDPTRLRILGLVGDKGDRPINQCVFGLPSYAVDSHLETSAEVILVVGSSMNSGKTTAAGTLAGRSAARISAWLRAR